MDDTASASMNVTNVTDVAPAKAAGVGWRPANSTSDREDEGGGSDVEDDKLLTFADLRRLWAARNESEAPAGAGNIQTP